MHNVHTLCSLSAVLHCKISNLLLVDLYMFFSQTKVNIIITRITTNLITVGEVLMYKEALCIRGIQRFNISSTGYRIIRLC